MSTTQIQVGPVSVKIIQPGKSSPAERPCSMTKQSAATLDRIGRDLIALGVASRSLPLPPQDLYAVSLRLFQAGEEPLTGWTMSHAAREIVLNLAVVLNRIGQYGAEEVTGKSLSDSLIALGHYLRDLC